MDETIAISGDKVPFGVCYILGLIGTPYHNGEYIIGRWLTRKYR